MFKVLLLTSQDIGNDAVSYFAQRQDVELLVVTQQTDRDRVYGYRATYDFCVENNIRAMKPEAFDEEFFSIVSGFSPDILLCAYYPRILPDRLLKLPPLGAVNVHPGLLPHYRGTFPTPWHILNNETEIGVTVHRMDGGIDTGDILVQQSFAIGHEETGHELYRRSMTLCLKVLTENFDGIVTGRIKPRPQYAGGSYYNKIEPQFRIDWEMSKLAIRNQVRVHAKPYFPAYSFLMNKCVLFNKVAICEYDLSAVRRTGVILEVLESRQFLVSCVDGAIRVEDYDVFPLINPNDMDLHIRAGNSFQ